MILHGDCRHVPLPARPIGLVVADPPYAVAQKRKYVRTDKPGVKPVDMDFGDWDYLTREQVLQLWQDWIARFTPACLKRASLYAFCPDTILSHVRDMLISAGWTYRNTLIWAKANPPPKFCKNSWICGHEFILYARLGKGAPYHWEKGDDFAEHKSVIEGPICGGRERKSGGHPTQKPLWLLTKLIARSSNPGDLVADPFAGSGSTGVAAVSLGREFWGVEQDEKHYRTAKRRVGGAQQPLPGATP